jgi:hypothetical protein
MAEDSEAVVELDTSADEQRADDSIVDLDAGEDVQDDEGDEILNEEGGHDESFEDPNETEPNDGATPLPGAEDAEEQLGARGDEGASLEQSLEQQSYEDPIAAQVREAIFMVFDSIDPQQPDDIFVKSAADVICKMVCSGTPATSVGVALETDNGALSFISLAEKSSEDTVDMASEVDRVLPPGIGVLHACLSQNAVVAIPNVLDEPSVHFFEGSRRIGALVAMPFADEANTTRGVICMDSCAPASAPLPLQSTVSELSEQALALEEEAEMMQAEADEVAADPDASEEDKQAAAAAAEEAREAAASARAAADADASAPAPEGDGDAASLPTHVTFSEDNISILEVMAHELSRAISMLQQRRSSSQALAAAAAADSSFASEVGPESPEPADDSFQSPGGDYEEEEMDEEALAAYEQQEAQKEELQARMREAIAQREQLLAQNGDLSKRVALYYHLKKNDESASLPAEDAERSVSDKEQRYFQLLQKLVVISQETQRVSEHYDRIERETLARLEEKKMAEASAAKDLQALRDEAAKGSDAGHSGRPVPPKLLKQLTDKERELDALLDEKRLVRIHFIFIFICDRCFGCCFVIFVSFVMLQYATTFTLLQSNLKLRHECKKLEYAIKKREEVSSELHMIDFEQLKIENQSLNEKIEERNEELLKLRKKTTSTVQVLTHLKEKLQFVQAENQVLKAELTGLESDLGNHRDAVTKVKLQRDQLRQENAKLKARPDLFSSFSHQFCNILIRRRVGWSATCFSSETSTGASARSRAWKYVWRH